MRYGIIRRIITVALAAAAISLTAFTFIACKDQQQTSSVRVKPLPKATKKSLPGMEPELLRTEKAGDDMRYVISYNGNEYHLIAGEKGLLGIRVIAPEEALHWTSLWLDFYPARPRPRVFQQEELATKDVLHGYVEDEYSRYLYDAKRLASIIAPNQPIVGEKFRHKQAVRTKLKGLAMPSTAVNELSIFSRYKDIMVIVNHELPARPPSGEYKNVGEFRFNDGLAEVCYAPDLAIARMKFGVQLYEINLLASKRSDVMTCYVDFLKLRDMHKDLEFVVKYDGGKVSITRFAPVEPGEELTIPEEYRRMTGMLLMLIDNQLYDPPQVFKDYFKVALSAITLKEKAHTHALMKEREGGVEDILLQLGR